MAGATSSSNIQIMSDIMSLFEPRYEKTVFLHMRKQRRRSASRLPAKLISAFVFATRIVQSLYFLSTKFQASSHLLWLYSPVCVGSGRKPRRPVFSERGSFQASQKGLRERQSEFINQRTNGPINAHLTIGHVQPL